MHHCTIEERHCCGVSTTLCARQRQPGLSPIKLANLPPDRNRPIHIRVHR